MKLYLFHSASSLSIWKIISRDTSGWFFLKLDFWRIRISSSKSKNKVYLFSIYTPFVILIPWSAKLVSFFPNFFLKMQSDVLFRTYSFSTSDHAPSDFLSQTLSFGWRKIDGSLPVGNAGFVGFGARCSCWWVRCGRSFLGWILSWSWLLHSGRLK